MVISSGPDPVTEGPAQPATRPNVPVSPSHRFDDLASASGTPATSARMVLSQFKNDTYPCDGNIDDYQRR